jgi:hypothetical protein
MVHRHMEEEFLGSGVVPRLVSLAKNQEHTFVQQKALWLLRQWASAFDFDNLQAFFNLTTNPLFFLMELTLGPRPANTINR